MGYKIKLIISLVFVTLLTACGGSGLEEKIEESVSPSIRNTSAQTYSDNTAISTLSFSNSGGGLLTACTADSLPSGLSVRVSSDRNTCEITGTPTRAQSTAAYTITATNAFGSDTAITRITVTTESPTFSAPTLANASTQTYTVNTAISVLRFTNSSDGSLTACTANSLPAGLSLAISVDGDSCEISGTPTEAQSLSSHMITATNASGSDTATVNIAVDVETVTPTLTTPVLANASIQTYTVSAAITVLSFSNSGGGSLATCTVDSLPAGLSVAISGDSSTCEISGVPTVVQTATAHTITATNSSGSDIASVSIAVNVGTPEIADASAKTYSINTSISTLLFTNGGGGLLSSCETDSLPVGLVVAVTGDGSTCEISGTPTELQVSTTYTITATNAEGSDTATVDISVSTRAFITHWKTDNPGETSDNQIMIGTQGGGYDYTIDWGDGLIDTNVDGNITHTYSSQGTYTVEISGDFPRIYFSSRGYDQEKLISIEQWGDIEWQSMSNAFRGCINLIGNAVDVPDLSQVTDMSFMFYLAANFNQEIGDWDVSSVTSMSNMFVNASAFNQNISGWDVSSATSMSAMFFGATAFNQGVSSWDVSSVENMASMFTGASAFNQDVSSWDVSSVQFMSSMFFSASAFNQDVSGWDVSAVANMTSMFYGASAFNQDISNWDVSLVINMNSMFYGATVFNQELNNWDVSSVIDMNSMFAATAAFDQNINAWDVSSVIDMGAMFYGSTAFNHDISSWDVSSVFNMNAMFFRAATFDQNLSSWDVSSVIFMQAMFSEAGFFDQDISSWDISSVTVMVDMFRDVTLSTNNYDALLLGWSAQGLQNNVNFNGGNSTYSSSSQSARDVLTESFNWTVTDGGVAP